MKKWFLILALLVVVGAAMATSRRSFVQPMPAAAVGLPNVTDGLIAWWKFDESSGLEAVDSVGGYNGFLTNSEALWEPGMIGNAVSLYITNEVRITNNPAALRGTNLSAYTFTCWFSITNVGSANYNAMFNKPNAYQFYTDPGSTPRFQYTFADWAMPNVRVINLATSAKAPTNSWVHLAIVVTNNTDSAAVAKIYTNATLIVSTASTNTSTYSEVNDLKLGDDMRGKMDDARVYNRALTAGEITTIYNWRP